MDDHATTEGQSERDHTSNWPSGNSSSSFSDSEVPDDDPLPAIKGLQIAGEAFPGQRLQAFGFSINGTTSCNFEWVRHQEDGSVNYIEGAKQPNYLVTDDDVDTYLAVEVQPLDDRRRKGELVKLFANEQRKIACDSYMQNYIEKTLKGGHASYRVFVSVTIPYGSATEFVITGSSGNEQLLQADSISTDVSRLVSNA